MVLEGAKRAGCRVTVVGLRGLADPDLQSRADVFRWAGIARVGRWMRVLAREGAEEVILAGSVNKWQMYGRFRVLRFLPDATGLRIWLRRTPDKRNDTLLNAVADEFEARFAAGESQAMLDKENIRQWLIGQGYMGEGEIPHIPDDVRLDLAEVYGRLHHRLLGRPFVPPTQDVSETLYAALGV